LDSVLLEDPKNLEAQTLSIYVLAFGEGWFEEARRIGFRLLSMPGLSHERRADVYWALGMIERHVGNTQEAVGYFTQYRDLRVWPIWYGNLAIAQTYRIAGQLEKALAAIEDALLEAPDQPLCLSERGIIRLRTGEVEPALADLRRAAELQPDNLAQRISSATELRWAGQTAVACEMLQEAYHLDPTNESVVQELEECP
jgi:tetratricopeptide (TPR) repeat protein